MKGTPDNRGFSLIELIIVIAIMAVLIGVLAPQYLKFATNARVATDVTNAQEIAKVIDAAIAGAGGSSVPLSITGAGGTAVSNVPGLTTLPNSKYDSSFQWNITSSLGLGVEEITLNGYVIYSKSGSSDAYYNQYYVN
ncbi:MAG: type II secretion system protein [Lachnospiraceae bacterium]|nr:type II secretion system protein [Lachnospiraceae bacterium]